MIYKGSEAEVKGGMGIVISDGVETEVVDKRRGGGEVVGTARE